MRNRAGNFSVGRLMEFLTALRHDVQITVRPSRKPHGSLSSSPPEPPAPHGHFERSWPTPFLSRSLLRTCRARVVRNLSSLDHRRTVRKHLHAEAISWIVDVDRLATGLKIGISHSVRSHRIITASTERRVRQKKCPRPYKRSGLPGTRLSSCGDGKYQRWKHSCGNSGDTYPEASSASLR